MYYTEISKEIEIVDSEFKHFSDSKTENRFKRGDRVVIKYELFKINHSLITVFVNSKQIIQFKSAKHFLIFPNIHVQRMSNNEKDSKILLLFSSSNAFKFHVSLSNVSTYKIR